MQLQEELDQQRKQANLAKRQLVIINPQRENPRDFRNEYERILSENASLKTAAAGNQEVCTIDCVMCGEKPSAFLR